MRIARIASLAAVVLVLPSAPLAQVILLNSLIGPSGTNATSVAGVGNVVNGTGVALNSGSTTLTAAGSAGSSSFNFNSGFSDGLDRATGSTAGAGNVYADRRYNSAVTDPMILDRNNNGLFTDETDSAPTDPNTFHLGFGLHGDTFITFDLAAIRGAHGLPSGQPFLLSGSVGVANQAAGAQASGAIILDSGQLALFDWRNSGPYHQYDTFSLPIAGSSRYLTFVGLSGLDGDNFYAHIGFGDVQLAAIPEPASYLLLLVGAPLVAALSRRRTGRG